MASVTLRYKWKYTVFGEFTDRFAIYPVVIDGKTKSTFALSKDASQSEQLSSVKAEMINIIKEYARKIAKRKWEDEEIDEDIGCESVKILDVREDNTWMALED